MICFRGKRKAPQQTPSRFVESLNIGSNRFSRLVESLSLPRGDLSHLRESLSLPSGELSHLGGNLVAAQRRAFWSVRNVAAGVNV